MKLNKDVTQFLEDLNHPLRDEIEALRLIILKGDDRLIENIKWNGPNYAIGADDRITMKIQPPKKIQVIFHRGAKVREQAKARLINDANGLLLWKENDRAIATFNTVESIKASEHDLTVIIQDWLRESIP